MPFSVALKTEAKSRQNFTCAWCRRPGQVLHVHHIVQEADDGPSTLENAVALCPTCHTQFGHNPHFRTEMVTRRDDWIKTWPSLYSGVDDGIVRQLDGMQVRLASLEEQQSLTAGDVRDVLSLYNTLIPERPNTPADFATTGAVLSATANVAGTYATMFGPVPAVSLIQVSARLSEGFGGERRLELANLGADILNLDIELPPDANLVMLEGELPLKLFRSGQTVALHVGWASSGPLSFEVILTGQTAEARPIRHEISLVLP